MSNVTLKVNGKTHTVDVDPSTPLLYVLRNDLDLHGPRFGCGLGQCGACTVIINGAAVRSCMVATSAVKGEITTLEGLSKDGKLHAQIRQGMAGVLCRCMTYYRVQAAIKRAAHAMVPTASASSKGGVA